MKKSLTIVAALALLVGSIASVYSTKSVCAQEASEKGAKATRTASEQSDPMKIAPEGVAGMQAIHAARLAIFNGETEMCEQLLAKSNEFIAAAENNESIGKTKTDLIPIDGRLTFDEAFVPTEESAKFIAKANEHFQKGEAEQGLEQLRLGEIDVTFARVLMPLESTKKQLAEALTLTKEHKYYEANLALKKAEDDLQFDSVSLSEMIKGESTAG